MNRTTSGIATCAIAVLAVVLDSCSSQKDDSGTGSVELTLASGLTKTRVTTGLGNATAFALAADGRIFVALRGTSGNGAGGTATASVRVVKNGTLLTTPFTNITVDNTSFGCCNERGLVGIAIDPSFSSNHFIYVYYTVPGSPAHNRVSRFTASGDVATGAEQPILDLESLTHPNHNGGALHFGADGKLYVAVGNDATNSNSQSISNRLGKILRINSDGTIPADNPSSIAGISGTTSGATRAIWAAGFRNPFTMAIHPITGRIFVNDVGESSREEVDELFKGNNYGWSSQEGFSGPDNASFTRPVVDYGHGDQGACAISGGTFYHPANSTLGAAYLDKYFFADYCGGWLRMLDPATRSVTAFDSGFDGPTDLGVGPDGALYVLARNAGEIWKIQGTGTVTQDTVVSTSTLNVPEASNATFTVQLAAQPSANVVVGVARTSGATTVAPSPTSLTFTSTNWSTPQTVTVSAADDTTVGNVSATIRVSSSGLSPKDVNVTVLDNDAAPYAPTAQISLPHNGDVISGKIAEYFGQGVPGGVQVAAIDCGGPAAGAYVADTSFTGGNVSQGTTTAIDVSAVVNPAPQKVYQSGRYGVYSYVIAGLTPNAGHVVRLHFAEYVWSGPGQRVFGVSVNGSPVLTNFDIFVAAGGKYKALIREFPTSADAAGKVTVTTSSAGADNPTIEGIQVFRGAPTVVRGEFYVDGVLKYTDVKNSPPDHYHFMGSHASFDTTAYANGLHTLKLNVVDQLGVSASHQINVTVSN